MHVMKVLGFEIKHGVANCDPLLIKACASGEVDEVFPNFLSHSLSPLSLSLSLTICERTFDESNHRNNFVSLHVCITEQVCISYV